MIGVVRGDDTSPGKYHYRSDSLRFSATLRPMEVTDRPLRADAERNRRRILAAAASVIARDGVDAGVDAIAREAGVGMGTLYRRFACKDDLVRAILDERAEITLGEMAAAAAAEEPWEALAGTLAALAGGFAGDQGLFDAVAEAGGRPQLLEVRSRFLDAMAPPLAAARAAQLVRDDVTVTDLVTLASIVARVPPSSREVDPRIWERFLGVVLDGLRPGSAHALPRAPLPREL
jgi:AcrR family transcriptional regulator